MTAPTTFSVAIACGTAGAYVDVSTYLESTEDFAYEWGRQSGFDDVDPGEFSFVLNNADGRFTPDNSASALATTLTEGMGVCWQLNTRLIAGTIQAIEPQFPGDVAAWSQVKVTCDDTLGDFARKNVDSLPQSIVEESNPYYHWPLDGSQGFARELNAPAFELRSGSVEWGVDGVPAVGTDQVAVFSTDDAIVLYASGLGATTTSLPATSGGYVNFWVTASDSAINSTSMVTIEHTNPGVRARYLGIENGKWVFGRLDAFLVLQTYPSEVTVVPGQPVHVSIGVEGVSGGATYTVTDRMYINSVLAVTHSPGTVASADWLAGRQVTAIGLGHQDNGTTRAVDPTLYSNVSYSLAPINEYVAVTSTPAERITALAATIPTATLATLPTDLATATVGVQEYGGSTLSALNDIIRGEQGHLYVATTGTVTSPTTTLNVVSRTRPTAVEYTYNIEADMDGSPSIVRDLTDLAYTVTVSGADLEVTVTDSTLASRARSRTVRENVPYIDRVPLAEYGYDRLFRGSNPGLRVSEIKIDARTTATDRWADLLAMQPGDRVQISGLPSTQLGFSTWDGWLLGASESHTTGSNEFVLYLEPCLPATGIFDTDRFMADGDLTLSAGITAVATSISVATVGATFTVDPTDFPQNIVIDSEEMTVTACSGATPQVMTVTRAANGTTAATHALGASVELANDTLFAY